MKGEIKILVYLKNIDVCIVDRIAVFWLPTSPHISQSKNIQAHVSHCLHQIAFPHVYFIPWFLLLNRIKSMKNADSSSRVQEMPGLRINTYLWQTYICQTYVEQGMSINQKLTLYRQNCLI